MWNRNQHHSLHLGSGERLASAPTLVVTVVPCYVSSRLRMVTGTTEEKWTGEDDRVEEHSSRQRQTERKKDMPEHGGDGS